MAARENIRGPGKLTMIYLGPPPEIMIATFAAVMVVLVIYLRERWW